MNKCWVSANNVENVYNFLTQILDLERKNHDAICQNFELLTIEETEIFIINEKNAPKYLNKNKQIIIEVTNSQKVCNAALKHGGVVLEESVCAGKYLSIIECIENIVLILMDKPNQDTDKESQNIFYQWILSSLPVPVETKLAPVKEETVSSTESTWASPRGSVIPTLFCHIKDNGTFKPFDPNSCNIPFKCDVFEGVAGLFIRTTPLSGEYKHIFQGNTATFEVQVQGRFTTVPDGYLFIGAEISKKMNLGMLTRSLCKSILNFARSTLRNPYLHHSFGDDNNDELPHITASLWSTADRMVVTPPGETPPPLGTEFPEDVAVRKQRRSNPLYQETIDLNSTYSISTKAKNIELCDWSLSGIPLMNSLDLHTFWADAFLRLCCYVVPKDAVKSNTGEVNLPEFHYQRTNQYCFAVDLRHISNFPDWSENDGSYDPLTDTVREFSDSNNNSNGQLATSSLSDNSKSIYNSANASMKDVNVELDEEDVFYDAEEGYLNEEGSSGQEGGEEITSNLSMFYTNTYTKAVNPSSSIDKKQVTPLFVMGDSSDARSASHREETVTDNSSSNDNIQKYVPTTNFPLSSFEFVPHVIQIYDVRFLSTGKRRDVFVLTIPLVPKVIHVLNLMLNSGSSSPNESVSRKIERVLYYNAVNSTTPKVSTLLSEKYNEDMVHGRVSALCSFTEFESEFKLKGLEKMRKPLNYERLSKTEQRRVDMNYILTNTFSTALLSETLLIQLVSYLFSCTHTDLLLSSELNNTANTKDALNNPSLIESSQCQGKILLRVGQTHWSEEFMVMTYDHLIFVKPSIGFSSSTKIKIPLSEVLEVYYLENNEFPLEQEYGFHVLIISTFSREYSVATRGMDMRNKWLQYFTNYLSLRVRGVSGSSISEIADFNNKNVTPSLSNMDLLMYPPDWKLGDRVLMNGRIFSGRLKNERNVSSGYSNRETIISNLVTPNNNTSRSSMFDNNDLVNEYIFPVAHVANTLEILLVLCKEENRDWDMSSNTNTNSIRIRNIWITFLDRISLLPTIDLKKYKNLTENDKICIFLNLYHILLLHSFLVVGIPSTLLKWPSFFNSCSYEAFGDIFSLAELEHCIIKYGIGRPNNLFVQALVPQTQYEFHVNRSDFRILWAMNCGSVSCPSGIPIYRPDLLDRQLNTMMTLCITRQTTITGAITTRNVSLSSGNISANVTIEGDVVINLPQVCQWYMQCITSNLQAGMKASNQLLNILSEYFTEEHKKIIETLLKDSKASYTIKYCSFDFRYY